MHGVWLEHHFVIDPDAGIAAQVVVVEPTGSETLVIARLAGQEVAAVFRDRLDMKPGDRLPLPPDPAAVHLFDADDVRRIGSGACS